LKFGDAALVHLGQPTIKALSQALTEHLGELLNQVIGQIDARRWNWRSTSKVSCDIVNLLVETRFIVEIKRGERLKAVKYWGELTVMR
jgi:hypothetical protein